MPSISFSLSFEDLQKVHEFNRKEEHKTMSAGITNLVKLGLAYSQMLEDQDKHQTKLGGT